MTIVRVLFLALFVGGLYALRYYLQEHPPKLSGKIVSFLEQPWIAVMRMWGPVLWIFPGILWIRLLNVHWMLILAISFFLPLSCFFAFYTIDQSNYMEKAQRTIILMITGLLWFFTSALIFLGVLNPELSYINYLVFLISVALPPVMALNILQKKVPKIASLGPEVEHKKTCAQSMFLSYFTSYPKKTWVIEDGEVQERIKGNQFMGAGPGWLLTEPENVVILKTGFKVTRIVGPGTVLTKKGEAPYKVIDLRNQIRTTRINAITRDGIEVQAPIGSLFRINQGNQEVTLGEPWPYHNYRDIFQAAYAEPVDPSGLNPLDPRKAEPWEDLPLIIAKHKLEQAMAFYSLDQLYDGITDQATAHSPGSPQAKLLTTHRRAEEALHLPPTDDLGDPLTRTTIGKLVRRAVQQALEPQGFDIHGGGVGNKIVPTNPQVTNQRVEAWKSRFIAKVMDWDASVQRKRFKALGKIQQDTRRALLTSIIEDVAEALEGKKPEQRANFVVYHLLDSLIRIARRTDVGSMLPKTALPTLEKLYKRAMVEKEREELI